MSEVTQQQSPEDLSKLKGPNKWWGVLTWLAMLVAVALIGDILHRHGMRGTPTWWEILMIACSVGGFVRFLHLWATRNQNGHTVRYWKDAEDMWRVTAQGYPEQAKGLVIEVQVKAHPSFKLRWGSKGWHKDPAGENYWVSNSGERLWAGGGSEAAREAEGLTEKVVELLHLAHVRWTIIPLDAGRVLRFVDNLVDPGCGIEARYKALDAVDIEEILKSVSCADYHARMQEKARIHDIATAQAGEAMVKLGLPTPSDGLPLVHRLGKLEEAGLKSRDARDEAWTELRLVLNVLHSDMVSAGRPKAKLLAARRVELLMKFLHEHLPADHSLRAGNKISQEALDVLAHLIAAEEFKLASAERSGGVGDKA